MEEAASPGRTWSPGSPSVQGLPEAAEGIGQAPYPALWGEFQAGIWKEGQGGPALRHHLPRHVP